MHAPELPHRLRRYWGATMSVFGNATATLNGGATAADNEFVILIDPANPATIAGEGRPRDRNHHCPARRR